VRSDSIINEAARAIMAEGTQNGGGPRTERPPSPFELAEWLLERQRFATDGGGAVFVYLDGVYRPGEDWTRRAALDQMERSGWGRAWSARRGEEVLGVIRLRSASLWETPPGDVIDVENGLLHVESGDLRPHTPDHLSPVRLPVRFDPAADGAVWRDFIAGTFPHDAAELAFEVLGWLLVPDVGLQKAVLLTGGGSNGKSAFLAAVTRLLGAANVSSVPLQRLEEDRFSVARLVGKLANICSDLPSTDLVSSGTFKALTGGDALLAERKFCTSFEVRPYARLVFSANALPRSRDASEAFFRRWVVVPFERVFDPEAPGFIPRERLDGMLAEPEALSGALNLALEGLRRLRRRGRFGEPASTQTALAEFRTATDPMAAWIESETMADPEGVTPKDAAFDAYRRFCERGNLPVPTRIAFGRTLSRLLPALAEGQRTVQGRLRWCHIGLALKTEREG
jgi:putative DNA primase/helicase